MSLERFPFDTVDRVFNALERFSDSIKIPINSAIASVAAQYHSAKYLADLDIRPNEFRRYFGKSTNLALCYAGFSQFNSSREAMGAGKAAFLSCAYDVATDWRDKGDPEWYEKFKCIVQAEASPELAEMALALFINDQTGQLDQDGLERGIVALRFVLEMMGLQEVFERKTDVNELGILLQIVDDVLDYEDDIQKGDENCLTSTRRDEYLTMLISGMEEEEITRLFPNGGILIVAIKRAREKAKKMLANSDRFFKQP